MLLPNEWIENSLETYIYQHTTKSQIIYWVVLLAITATMIALPFIYVDISVQGSGVVRPVTEKTEIKSAITELVDSIYVREGTSQQGRYPSAFSHKQFRLQNQLPD